MDTAVASTFLQHINNQLTHWNVCVGVPFGKSYWQFRDSSEQNGCFNMALTKYKQDLLTRKLLVGDKFVIEKEDVTYLVVSRARLDSFARIHTNKNAIAKRGWTTLNYICVVLHPEIASTRWQGRVEQEHSNNCGDNDNNDTITVETGNCTNRQQQHCNSCCFGSTSRSYEPLSRTQRHSH
jgi:hypothetical protein